MAQRAAQAAQRRAVDPTEALLAQLLTQRAMSLQERAQAEGVTAFLRRPPVRGRLNERFLQNTLRGVRHANRRTEEAELWELREAQQDREAREAEEAAQGRAADEARGRGGRDGARGRGDMRAHRPRSRSRSRSPPPARERSREAPRPSSEADEARERGTVSPNPRSVPRRRPRSTSSSGSRSPSGSKSPSPPRLSADLSAAHRDGREPPRRLDRDRYHDAVASGPAGGAAATRGGVGRDAEQPSGDGSGGGSSASTSTDTSGADSEGSSGGGEREDSRGRYRGSTPREGGAGGADARGASDAGGSGGVAGDGGGDDDGPYLMTDEEIAAMLSRHRVRGRGGVGSKADAVGPEPKDAREEDERGGDGGRRSQRGPAVPAWLRAAVATQHALASLGLPVPAGGPGALALQALQQGLLQQAAGEQQQRPRVGEPSRRSRKDAARSSKRRDKDREKDREKRRKEKSKGKEKDRDRGRDKDRKRKHDKERSKSKDRRDKKEKKSRSGH